MSHERTKRRFTVPNIDHMMKRLFTITDHYVGQWLTVRVDGKLMLTPLALVLAVVARDQRFARSGASAAVPRLIDADLRAVKGHSSALRPASPPSKGVGVVLPQEGDRSPALALFPCPTFAGYLSAAPVAILHSVRSFDH
jgi:hypothetical protein